VKREKAVSALVGLIDEEPSSTEVPVKGRGGTPDLLLFQTSILESNIAPSDFFMPRRGKSGCHSQIMKKKTFI